MKMNIEKHYQRHGQPHLKLGNLEMWIFGYQFPSEISGDDANWLNVAVICKSDKTIVKTDGSILQTYDLDGFVSEIENMYQTLSGSATLTPLEPNFNIILQMDKLGHVLMKVEVTPDHLNETHKYEFAIDQSFLPNFIKQCRDVLRKYPIRV